MSQHAYSALEEQLECFKAISRILRMSKSLLANDLRKLEKDDLNARQKANVYVNRLHTIKRYMEKRNLPGIPQSFLKLFFTASP